jgi:hypothetical protein
VRDLVPAATVGVTDAERDAISMLAAACVDASSNANSQYLGAISSALRSLRSGHIATAIEHLNDHALRVAMRERIKETR